MEMTMDETVTLAAGSTALLLMDLQHATLGSIPDVERLLDRAELARGTASAAGVAVVHVRVAFRPDDHAAVPDHHRVFAAIAEGGHFAEGSAAVDIHPRLRPTRGEHVVTKTRTGALATTGLDAWLRERGIDTLVLTGIWTSGVVLSTLIDAADRDYRLFVLADACADPDTDLHERLLATVLARQAQIIDTARFVAALRPGNGTVSA
jgi:nicotinamidase-related amidase